MWRNHLLLDKGQSDGFQYAIRVRQLPAIEFHDQPCRAASKIGDKGSDRTLSHKTDVQTRAA